PAARWSRRARARPATLSRARRATRPASVSASLAGGPDVRIACPRRDAERGVVVDGAIRRGRLAAGGRLLLLEAFEVAATAAARAVGGLFAVGDRAGQHLTVTVADGAAPELVVRLERERAGQHEAERAL